MDMWEFHTVGDADCDACVVEPTSCDCGGLIHTHFATDLEAIEGRCDQCKRVDEPAFAVVD